MSIAAWIVVGVIAYLALGSFVGSGLRARRDQQTRPAPPVHQVRDERLDIGPALQRSRAISMRADLAEAIERKAEQRGVDADVLLEAVIERALDQEGAPRCH